MWVWVNIFLHACTVVQFSAQHAHTFFPNTLLFCLHRAPTPCPHPQPTPPTRTFCYIGQGALCLMAFWWIYLEHWWGQRAWTGAYLQ